MEAASLPDFRPRWHFSARRYWINDPNGLIWLDGEYHLFFQHNPFGDQWGHMSWGHAVSRDLLRWDELPLAIPEDERVSIFSGSVVWDEHDTSGFGRDAQGRGPLVAVYTGCRRVPEGGQAQELSFSRDRGRTWTPFAGNPVLDLGLRDFRDPKVFWHAPTGRWVMAVVLPDDHVVRFYGSANLRAWTHLSDFGPAGEAVGIWECPDLIEFPAADGAPARWLLKVDSFSGHPGGTGAQVFIGHFDGVRFTADPAGTAGPNAGLWVDHGSDFYAALSWAGLPPGPDGRPAAPLWIGWMNNHAYAKATPTSTPDAPWRGAMSLPRTLAIAETARGPRLTQHPWPGLAVWRQGDGAPERLPIRAGLHALPELDAGGSVELQLDLDRGGADAQWLVLRSRAASPEAGLRVGVDWVRACVFVDRSDSGLVPDPDRWSGRRACPLPAVSEARGAIRLRVLLDRCSVEVFSEDGLAVITELFFPLDDARALGWAIEGPGAGESLLRRWVLNAPSP